MGGFNRLIDWGQRHGLVPSATLVGILTSRAGTAITNPCGAYPVSA